MDIIGIFNLIGNIDDEEKLREIGNTAFTRIKNIRRTKADKTYWYVNQSVRLKPQHQDKKLGDTIGKVKKVNKVKLKVVFNNVVWTVPKSMLEVVETID